MVLGVLLLCYGLFASWLGATAVLSTMGGGTLLLFIGVAVFSPRIARPLASALGRPFARFGGASGKLARENAMRNPGRTATTAAALMIGLALVTFVAVLSQGLRSSFESAADRLFVADYALTSSNTFDPITVQAEQALRGTPELVAVSGIRA